MFTKCIERVLERVNGEVPRSNVAWVGLAFGTRRECARLPPMRLLLLSSFCALVLLSVFVAPAAAQEEDAAARDHFRSGQHYFDRGQYEDELREFSRAYDLSQRPQLLYNIFVCQERVGQLAEAERSLTAYMEATPDLPNRAIFVAARGSP